MFVPNNSYVYDDRTLTDDDPLPKILTEESEFVVEKVHSNDLHAEEATTTFMQKNLFFEGLLYAIPVGVMLWVAIIWAIYKILMNAGGGTLGTG